MRAEAITFDKPGVVSVREVEIPSPTRGEILVRTTFSGVSPGTELRSLAGQQVGTKEWPFIPGYSLAGTVAEVGDGVEVPLGARVFAAGTERASIALLWGGHVGYALVSEQQVHVADPQADLAELSLVHLLAIAHHGVRMAATTPGERVAVIGLGPIGQLSARLFAPRGAEVRAFDLRENRVEIARAAGIRAYAGGAEPDWADVVVDATGSPSAFSATVSVGRAKAWSEPGTNGIRILIQGSYPADLVIPYDDLFSKQASVLFPRSADRSDIRSVIELLGERKLSMIGLCEPAVVTDAVEVYRSLAEGARLSAVFRWGN